jgi:hypothetical protein
MFGTRNSYRRLRSSPIPFLCDGTSDGDHWLNDRPDFESVARYNDYIHAGEIVFRFRLILAWAAANDTTLTSTITLLEEEEERGKYLYCRLGVTATRLYFLFTLSSRFHL